MDDLSAEMYSHVDVIFELRDSTWDEVIGASTLIFGREMSAEDFIELIGAPNKSDLTLSVEYDGDSVILNLGYEWIKETHDYKFLLDAQGNCVVLFENIQLEEAAPSGLELRMFIRQVRAFQKYGVNRVELVAEGHGLDPYWAGYYAWAKYGFVMYLSGRDVAGSEFADVEDTVELLRRPRGSEWWKKNGTAREAYFYLDKDSVCLQALSEYARSKGVEIDD